MPVALILAGAGVVGLTLYLALTYSQLATGIPTMDRPQIRFNVLKEAEFNGLDPQVLVGLIYSESRGDPNNFVGDGGTSFGPGQAHLGGNPDALGAVGYTGNGQDLLDEATGIKYAALVLKFYLGPSYGNGDYRTAIAWYKGGHGWQSEQAQGEMRTTVDTVNSFFPGAIA